MIVEARISYRASVCVLICLFVVSVGEVHLFSPSGKVLGQVGRVSVMEPSHASATLTQSVAAMTFMPPLKDIHCQDV